MKVLVTGANGYLGQGIVRAMAAQGMDIVATDFRCDQKIEHVTMVEGNIFELDNPYEYFGQPDVLVHLAWRDGFVHNSNAHLEDLPKHYQFLETMIQAGVKQVAVMGSMHEIGFFEGSIHEDTPCHPMSLYGISKNALRDATELLCKKSGCIFQWLRGYYIVGNSVKGSSIFSKLAAAAQEGKKEFPFTMGQNQYDFLDYEEFCEQVASAVNQSEIDGIINICSGRPEKLADRVERFITENGYDIQLKYGAFPDRAYDSKAIWGDDSKIKKIIENKENA